jgi:hypothetical protein
LQLIRRDNCIFAEELCQGKAVGFDLSGQPDDWGGKRSLVIVHKW